MNSEGTGLTEQQALELIAQMNISAQLGTCSSTNTKDLARSRGQEFNERAETVMFPNPMFPIAFWKRAPAVPHHKYIHCPVGDFENHQIPVELLAQERDNFIQKKMQNHLRALKKIPVGTLSEEERQKHEFTMHCLYLSSRQRYVRDNFFNSYTLFIAGKKYSNNLLKSIYRVPKLTTMEQKKGYVIRGISYNDFLWPKGKDFTPATPFSILPRHIIRNREKDKTFVDLNSSLPVVLSVLSESASIVVASHGFKFFNDMRAKFHQRRTIRYGLQRYTLAKQALIENLELQETKPNEDDPELFEQSWPKPVFTHPIRALAQPLMLTDVVMHPHQLHALAWLVHMFDHHVNALLADEVGLGKTLQVISFFAYLKESRNINGPHLIIVPSAVMVTWKAELEKAMPSANLVIYNAKAKHRHNLFESTITRIDFDILLTTYDILKQDIGQLSQITWRSIVFDEGHKIKNPKSKLFNVVNSSIFGDFRVLITASPFQNCLEELWALMCTLEPNVFYNQAKFKLFFKRIESKDGIGETAQKQLIKRLQDVLRPYVLRRGQSEVAVEIPGKFEVTIKIGPSAIQKSIMQIATERDYNVQQKIYVSKRVSNSPVLFLPRTELRTVPPEYAFLRSPKIQILDAILRKLLITGHRFLIYSQWTQMMDLLETFLRWRQIDFRRIDGSVSTAMRARVISEFVAPASPVRGMLLSTRSSAEGLNLQVADTVILFDSDYNPFVELQASARVHRMGQQNPVLVIRLMMLGTGEEQILRIARRKFRIGTQIVDAGKFNLVATEEEKLRALDIPVDNAREITEPSDADLNEIIARGEEEAGRLAFATDVPQEVLEQPEFADLDQRVIDAYVALAEHQGAPKEAEQEIDEFEDVE